MIADGFPRTCLFLLDSDGSQIRNGEWGIHHASRVLLYKTTDAYELSNQKVLIEAKPSKVYY